VYTGAVSTKGKGKCGFIEHLVVITPLTRSGIARDLTVLPAHPAYIH